MGRALISHLSTNDINKSLVGNGGERDEASAESEGKKSSGVLCGRVPSKGGLVWKDALLASFIKNTL